MGTKAAVAACHERAERALALEDEGVKGTHTGLGGDGRGESAHHTRAALLLSHRIVLRSPTL